MHLFTKFTQQGNKQIMIMAMLMFLRSLCSEKKVLKNNDNHVFVHFSNCKTHILSSLYDTSFLATYRSCWKLGIPCGPGVFCFQWDPRSFQSWKGEVSFLEHRIQKMTQNYDFSKKLFPSFLSKVTWRGFFLSVFFVYVFVVPDSHGAMCCILGFFYLETAQILSKAYI